MLGVLALLLTISLSACAHSTGGTPQTGSSAPLPSADVSSPAPSTGPTNSAPSTPVSSNNPTDPYSGGNYREVDLTLSAADGTKIDGYLDLTPIQPAGAPALSANWQRLSHGAAFPCSADPGRDGVVIGDVAFSNTTPNFSASLRLEFHAAMEVRFSLGVATTDQPTCRDSISLDPPAIEPNFESTTWGPVAIEFVIPDYYSPAHPHGDPSKLKVDSIFFAALASDIGQPYNVHADSNLLTIEQDSTGTLNYLRLDVLDG